MDGVKHGSVVVTSRKNNLGRYYASDVCVAEYLPFILDRRPPIPQEARVHFPFFTIYPPEEAKVSNVSPYSTAATLQINSS
jgi:hypothetical protein